MISAALLSEGTGHKPLMKYCIFLFLLVVNFFCITNHPPKKWLDVGEVWVIPSDTESFLRSLCSGIIPRGCVPMGFWSMNPSQVHRLEPKCAGYHTTYCTISPVPKLSSFGARAIAQRWGVYLVCG